MSQMCEHAPVRQRCIRKSTGNVKTLRIELLPSLHAAVELNTAFAYSTDGELVCHVTELSNSQTRSAV